jgi:valyl-tRNA synthetase
VDAAMTEFAFGEVTRLLYEAIWSEFCDWGLELAKVRLADDSLPASTREATWWTLVEVLDGYLRLLHPVMPFITEALWGSLPHRASDPDLLIVARWPAVGPRDTGVEAELEEIVELVTAIRTARSTARIEAGVWHETSVYVPADLGPTFETLRPAIERLARARPLDRQLTSQALQASARPGDLKIILPAGDIEAVVHTVSGALQSTDTTAMDRARLERELAEAEGWLAAVRDRLANDAFTSRAPAPVVEGARARETELADQVARLRDALGR